MDKLNSLIKLLTDENGYIEKRKQTPTQKLYEKNNEYNGKDNWVKYWRDLTHTFGLANYQGSYYCIASIFWGFCQIYGLKEAQRLCRQDFMINCQVTYNLFNKAKKAFIYPKVGDIVVFWNGNRFHHAEFVTEVNDKALTCKTVGFNTTVNTTTVNRNGGGVNYPKVYSIRALQQHGDRFLRPDYKEVRNGWEKVNKDWVYYDNGEKVKNQWKLIDGDWYVFDREGYMIKGYYEDNNGNTYYLNKNGTMSKGNWIQNSDGSWSYTDSKSGILFEDVWFNYNNKWYYFDSKGRTLHDAIATINGQKYAFLNDSSMLSNSWFISQDDWYYASSTGAFKHSSWLQQEDGNFYYLKEDCKMAKNAYIKDEYSETLYFVDDNGIYQSDKDLVLDYPIVK